MPRPYKYSPNLQNGLMRYYSGMLCYKEGNWRSEVNSTLVAMRPSGFQLMLQPSFMPFFFYHLCCLTILQVKWLFQKSRKGRIEKYVTNGEEIAIQPKLPHAFPRAQLEE